MNIAQSGGWWEQLQIENYQIIVELWAYQQTIWEKRALFQFELPGF